MGDINLCESCTNNVMELKSGLLTEFRGYSVCKIKGHIIKAGYWMCDSYKRKWQTKLKMTKDKRRWEIKETDEDMNKIAASYFNKARKYGRVNLNLDYSPLSKAVSRVSKRVDIIDDVFLVFEDNVYYIRSIPSGGWYEQYIYFHLSFRNFLKLLKIQIEKIEKINER